MKKEDMNFTPGAVLQNDGSCTFTVWSPEALRMELILKDKTETIPLHKMHFGYWQLELDDVIAGTQYKFKKDGKLERPDPASRSQPEGVHSWSQVISRENYDWKTNNWKGVPQDELVIYELHIGTFTAEGTFEAVTAKIEHLLELGINAIEIMPVSQFPGDRNWGYDGVYPYAVQHSYGGPAALKKMIDTCHQNGIAVILDAVYNHMGPEGNYLADFGPYFTDKYKTPWGSAINFDDKYSDHVRNFFLKSAEMWLREFRFDALRLDAIHEIVDRGATHFLKELSLMADEVAAETDRKIHLIAESDLNDVKIINNYDKGGYGLEAQWVDDFHHSVHALITGEQDGYYTDYGSVGKIEKAFRQAFVYDGVYSEFRKRRVGSDPTPLPPEKFVVCIQNHDQVGNRMLGERLSQITSTEKLKLAAGTMLVSPYIPMLFMGEEYAEDKPFQYFVSHGDPQLVKAVQEGRKREFQYFNEKEGEFPDPQSEETFDNSTLNWNFKADKKKNSIFSFYKKLLMLRKEGAFNGFRNKELKTHSDQQTQILSAYAEGEIPLFAVFNFDEKTQKAELPTTAFKWEKIMASADREWLGDEDIPAYFNSKEFEVPGSSFIIIKKAGRTSAK